MTDTHPHTRMRSGRLVCGLGRVLITTCWAAAAVGTPARAQDAAPPVAEGVDPLAQKEMMIRDRFQRFEDRVFRLRQQLSEVEPENAARLARVLESAGEFELSDRLNKISQMLQDPSQRNDAIDAQGNWVADAERVLGILMERDSGNEQRKDKIDELQEHLESLDGILQEQRAVRQSSAQAALGRRMSEQLGQAIQRIQAMLDDQSDVKDGPADEQAQRRQQDLQRDAQDLAEQLERLQQDKPSAESDSDALQQARQQAGQASQSMKSGAKAMSQAGNSMQQGDSPKSQQSQAEQDLQQAKETLEEAKRALDEQFDLNDMAQKQEDVSEQTKDLAQKMGQQGGAQSGGQGGEGQEGQPNQGDQKPQGGKQQEGQQQQSGGQSQPGAQGVQKAQEHMDKAQSELDRQAPDDAVPEQDQAIDQLEQARKELEELLQQLRKEERAETLRDLEVRFRDMLAKQRSINTETVALDEIGRDSFQRAEELKSADLAAKERALSVDAATCLHILEEDATTVVFPRIVDQISTDMATVADRLAELQVSALTQQIETEIVEALEQLLDAVQQMQQENEQQGGNSAAGRSPEDEGLLPTSAELKLLRSSQLRVNVRTKTIESSRQDPFQTEEDLSTASQQVANRQKELSDVATEMRDRQNQP